jgi:hypothetical protein
MKARHATVDALPSALAVFGSGTRTAIDQVDQLKDADTVDILTEISCGIDEWLRFVEATSRESPRARTGNSDSHSPTPPSRFPGIGAGGGSGYSREPRP